jgi:hypothetical protein
MNDAGLHSRLREDGGDRVREALETVDDGDEGDCQEFRARLSG